MSDLTIFPADIAEMSVSQLAALPAAQKHEIDKNLDAAIDWLKKARTKFDAALDQCYGEQARVALRESGRDFGTAHISDGVLRIKFELPKKTSWNQDMARELAARIVRLRRQGRALLRHQVLGSRIPLHELATGPATAVRRCSHRGCRQAVFHPFHRFGGMTMSAIIPFQFDAHAVRVQIDDLGLPWFNANDVCSALEFANPHKAVADHVDADDLTKREVIDTLGRPQRANFINESGLYALILGSTKDAAKRFKRWVTSEVLPAIRKTGAYSVPGEVAALPAPTQDRVSAILLIGEAIAKVPGVKTGIAMAATLTCIQENTGLTVETLRRTLPAAVDPICALNATQLGKLLGRSAKGTNRLLADHGLQFRNDRDEWELTEAGEAWAEAMPYSRNGHSGYQILWSPAVVEQIKEAA